MGIEGERWYLEGTNIYPFAQGVLVNLLPLVTLVSCIFQNLWIFLGVFSLLLSFYLLRLSNILFVGCGVFPGEFFSLLTSFMWLL